MTTIQWEQFYHHALEKGLQKVVHQAKTWQGQETFADDVALVGLEIL